MARGWATPADLEVEDIGAPAGGNRRRPRHQGRLIAVVATVVAVLAAVFPLRAQVNRSEAARLERRWRGTRALDDVRSSDLVTLERAAAPGDDAKLHSAIAALYHEQATDLIAAARRLRGDVIVDVGLRRLRAAMTHALTLDAADVAAAGEAWAGAPAGRLPDYLDRRPAATDAVRIAEGLLAGQERRFGLGTTRPPGLSRFQSADAALATFKRFLDEPVAVTLLADTSAGLQAIDVDHDRIIPVSVAGLAAGTEDIVAARPGLVVLQHPAAYGAQSSFFVAPTRLPGSATFIGTGQQVVPGGDTGTVWLIRSDDSTVQVDVTGFVRAGPVPLPPNRFVVGVTGSGLVLQPHLRSDRSLSPEPIEIWDPLQRRVVRRLTDSGLGVVAADAGTVAWLPPTGSGGGTLHLADVASGTDRLVAIPGFTPEAGNGAFSPDGRRLAIALRSADGAHTVLAVVDVGSGMVHVGAADDFPLQQPGLITWTAAGDRIFVTMSSANPTGQVLTYRPGDPSGHYLRLSEAGGVGVYAVVALDPQP